VVSEISGKPLVGDMDICPPSVSAVEPALTKDGEPFMGVTYTIPSNTETKVPPLASMDTIKSVPRTPSTAEGVRTI